MADANLVLLQHTFPPLVARLIDYAYAQGYQLTFGEAFRTLAAATEAYRRGTGILNSLHRYRLAIDFNLFHNGLWLQDSAAHKPLGDYWKTLHPAARWGGDFDRPDGNHYSLTYNGTR